MNEKLLFFSGVDMVDGTPVLDIKPYIPQYDYPGIANIIIRENSDCGTLLSNADNYENERQTDEITQVEHLNERVMDGEENGHFANLMPLENSR